MAAIAHARIREVFLEVVALPPGERQAGLERACAGDAALRAEVTSLLAHEHDASLLAESTERSEPRRLAPIRPGSADTVKWNEEQRQLLHQRIRIWALAVHMPVVFILARAFGLLGGGATNLGTGPTLGLAVGGLCGLCLAVTVLRLRSPSVSRLRGFEVALSLSAGAVIFSWGQAWLTRGATLSPPVADQLGELFRTVYWVAAPDSVAHVTMPHALICFPIITQWCTIGLLYGLVVPNAARRGVSMVVAIVLAACATVLVAALGSPALRPYAASNLIACALTVGSFSAIAMVLSLRFQALRRAVFEARQVGQYRLVRLLGQGTMGEVYLAQHQLLHRPCAVKLIHPEHAGSNTTLRRFEREVQAMARLTHPNIVEVYDFGRTEDDSFFYAMEYLPGATLDALVRTHGPLPPGRVVYLLLQVCGALAEAHRKGLVHRDIKPGNIFVSERGGSQDFIKLLDFGLVHSEAHDPAVDEPRPARADPHLTLAGQRVGTPAFMSPEQIRGEPTDARSDLYSLGGVACFLLTGRPPFERETIEELFKVHLEAPVPRLREWDPAIPADLEAVTTRCLAKQPCDRFQSAAELLAVLAATTSAGQWDSARAEVWWQEHAPIVAPTAVSPAPEDTSAGSTGRR